MTFTEIVNDVLGRLNLTSSEATTRVGLRVNRRYRRVTTSIGLLNFRRISSQFAVTTGTRLQTITGIERVISINDNSTGTARPLDELSYGEMIEKIPHTGVPYFWAVKRADASSVTLMFDSTMTSALTLTVEGEEVATTLSGSQVPAFSESFHDVLVFGALADELRKMEKTTLARDAELEYERILGELRLHQAVSGYKDIQQGKKNSIQLGDGSVSGGTSNTTVHYDHYTLINVKDPVYGAAGNGTTDDTAAVNAALATAVTNGGGIVFFPAGTYRLTAQITVETSGISFWGEGRDRSILKWDDTAVKGIVYTGASPLGTTALAANVAIGDRSVTVSSAVLTTAGRWVILTDSTSGVDLQGNGAFISRIIDVSGTTVTLEDGIPLVLRTSASALATIYETTAFLTGCRVRDLQFSCGTVNCVNKLTHLQFSRCVGPVVENCTFKSAVAPLVTPVSCRDLLVTGNQFELAFTVAGAAVEVQTSTASRLINNTARRCRFGLTATASPRTVIVGNNLNGREPFTGVGGRGIRLSGQSNNSVVDGNQVSDTALYGIYVQASRFVVVSGNALFGIGYQAGEHAIQIATSTVAADFDYGTDCVVSANNIANCLGSGITINYADADTDQPGRCLIIGNVLSDCRQNMILIRSSYNNVIGNRVRTNDVTAGAGIATAALTTNNAVLGNFVLHDGVNSNAAISTDLSAGANRVTGNMVNGRTVSTHATDTTDTTLVTDIVDPRKLVTPLGNNTTVGTDADLLEKTLATFAILANSMPANLVTGARIWGRMTVVAGGGTIRFKIAGVTVFTVLPGGITVDGTIGFNFDIQRSGATAVVGSAVAILTGATFTIAASTNFSATFDHSTSVAVTVTGQNDAVAAANRIQFNSAFITFYGAPQGAYV